MEDFELGLVKVLLCIFLGGPFLLWSVGTTSLWTRKLAPSDTGCLNIPLFLCLLAPVSAGTALVCAGVAIWWPLFIAQKLAVAVLFWPITLVLRYGCGLQRPHDIVMGALQDWEWDIFPDGWAVLIRGPKMVEDAGAGAGTGARARQAPAPAPAPASLPRAQTLRELEAGIYTLPNCVTLPGRHNPPPPERDITDWRTAPPPKYEEIEL